MEIPRWQDNNDGTITDTSTTLIWLKDAGWGDSQTLWSSTAGNIPAHHKVSSLKNGVGGLSDGSEEGDWRLPTKTELSGLANGDEAVRAGTPQKFQNVSSAYYSTSSTRSKNQANIWNIHLGTGETNNTKKVNSPKLWPVRNG